MALFSFKKKEMVDQPLVPPKPPAGLPPLSGAVEKSATPPAGLPPLPPLAKPEPRPALPPLGTLPTEPPKPALASVASLPPLPKPVEKPALPPLGVSTEKPALASIMKPAVPPAPAFAPARMSIGDEFAPKPNLSVPLLSTPPAALPPLPKPTDKPITPPAVTPIKPLPALADIPRISVKEETKPIDPFSVPVSAKLPETPVKLAEPSSPLKAPEPLKRENSRLAKVLEELTMEDFDLPALSPLKEMPETTPAFQPQIARAPIAARYKKLYVTLHEFEETASELANSEQHLHNLQAHNEKLGIIETHTKNELETLVTVFEILERQLLAMDDKLFATQGEH